MTLNEGDLPRWSRNATVNEHVRLSGTLSSRGLQSRELSHRERAKTGERPDS